MGQPGCRCRTEVDEGHTAEFVHSEQAMETPPVRLVTMQDLQRSWSKQSNSVQGESPEYTGSYGLLLKHFKACRRERIITEERYKELTAALEDVCRSGDGRARAPPADIGGQQQDALLLSSMGFSASKALSFRAMTFDFSEGTGRRNRVTNPMLCNWRFDCRAPRGDIWFDIQAIASGFSAPNDLIKRYKMDVEPLTNWIGAIASQYRPNHYHNWAHALDVFQMCYLGLTAGGGSEFLTYQDILVILVATIGHDVAHPGATNPFLINSGSPLALTYNDKSPSENLHASIVFQTLLMEGNNFLANLSKHDYGKTRAKIIDVILATDMVHHFTLVDQLTSRLLQKEDKPLQVDTKEDQERIKASQDDRRILIQAFVHMADIGNACRPWNVYKELVIALEEEFFAQGDQERELGLPIMPMMDRTKDSLALSQDFFLSKLVLPLLEPICTIIQEDLGQFFLENLSENRRNVLGLVQRYGKKPAKELLMHPLVVE